MVLLEHATNAGSDGGPVSGGGEGPREALPTPVCIVELR